MSADDGNSTAAATASTLTLDQEQEVDLTKEDDGVTAIEVSYGLPAKIWDFGVVVQLLAMFDKNGKQLYNPITGKAVTGWRCDLCGLELRGINATKAMYHLTRTPGREVQLCTADVPTEDFSKYCAFRDKKTNAKASRKRAHDLHAARIDRNQLSLAVTLENKRMRSSKCATARRVSNGTMPGKFV